MAYTIFGRVLGRFQCQSDYINCDWSKSCRAKECQVRDMLMFIEIRHACDRRMDIDTAEKSLGQNGYHKCCETLSRATDTCLLYTVFARFQSRPISKTCHSKIWKAHLAKLGICTATINLRRSSYWLLLKSLFYSNNKDEAFVVSCCSISIVGDCCRRKCR